MRSKAKLERKFQTLNNFNRHQNYIMLVKHTKNL
jgi:hypothetical protein